MAIKKNILITAGPTWVAIDSARVISNISSGQTGFILADKFKKLGAKVTLLLGPGYFCGPQAGIKIIRFKYFDELKQLLKKELKKATYSVIIHAAAVADYRPQGAVRNKISSQLKGWRINLVPTDKLIDSFKDYGANLFTVGFKLEPSVTDKQLIKKGKQLLKRAGLDLVVSNSCGDRDYRAFILDKSAKYGPYLDKVKMVDFLAKLLQKRIL